MIATKDGTADRITVCSWECIYGIEFCFFGVGEAWWQYGRLWVPIRHQSAVKAPPGHRTAERVL